MPLVGSLAFSFGYLLIAGGVGKKNVFLVRKFISCLLIRMSRCALSSVGSKGGKRLAVKVGAQLYYDNNINTISIMLH